MQGFLTSNKLAAGSAGWRWLRDLKESLDCSCSPPTPGRKVKDDYISAPLALFSVAGAKSDKLSLGAPRCEVLRAQETRLSAEARLKGQCFIPKTQPKPQKPPSKPQSSRGPAPQIPGNSRIPLLGTRVGALVK